MGELLGWTGHYFPLLWLLQTWDITSTGQYLLFFIVVVVQLLSSVQLFMTSWTIAHQAPLSSTVSQCLLKFMSFELVMLSNHLILCCPLLLLPSFFPRIKVFSMSRIFTSGRQSTGASASATVHPVHIQGRFPSGLTGLIHSSFFSWIQSID